MKLKVYQLYYKKLKKKIYQFHDIDGACNNPTPQYYLKHNLRQMNKDVYYEICNTKI